MEKVLLAVHLIVAISLVIVVLLQRSEGGALGIGGGPTGMMSARGAANLLSRITKWLAIIFITNSLVLGWFAANRNESNKAVEIAEQIKPEAKKKESGDNPTFPAKDKKDN